MQRAFLDMDDIKTEGALTKLSITHMTDSINKIQNSMEENFRKVFQKFEDQDNKYVSKDEHKENRIRITSLETELAKAKEKVQGIDLKIAGYTAAGGVILFVITQFLSKTIHF